MDGGFDEFWTAVNNLMKGNVRLEYFDGVLSSDGVSYAMDIAKCFEFMYDGIYRTENSDALFNGIFFKFEENNLVFGYYTANENGGYATDIIDGREINIYSAVYGVSIARHCFKISKISNLINL